MSLACRHCYKNSSSSRGVGGSSDVSSTTNSDGCVLPFKVAITHGSKPAVWKNVEEVESALGPRGVIPGVTAWCEKCKRISILSYALYLAKIMEAGKSSGFSLDTKMGEIEYYSFMCGKAETFSHATM